MSKLNLPDIQKEHAIETYKSLIQVSIAGMKLLALLNGGAVVALLAYLGNLRQAGHVPDMRWPIGCYLAGLVCCGLTFLGSYLTQLQLYQESALGAPERHKAFLWPAIGCAFLSLAAFALGSFLGVARLKSN